MMEWQEAINKAESKQIYNYEWCTHRQLHEAPPQSHKNTSLFFLHFPCCHHHHFFIIQTYPLQNSSFYFSFFSSNYHFYLQSKFFLSFCVLIQEYIWVFTFFLCVYVCSSKVSFFLFFRYISRQDFVLDWMGICLSYQIKTDTQFHTGMYVCMYVYYS